jgi:hypothetical protein
VGSGALKERGSERLGSVELRKMGGSVGDRLGARFGRSGACRERSSGVRTGGGGDGLTMLV